MKHNKPLLFPLPMILKQKGWNIFLPLYIRAWRSWSLTSNNYDSYGYGYIKDAGSSGSSSYTYTIANTNKLNGYPKYVVEGGTATFAVTGLVLVQDPPFM